MTVVVDGTLGVDTIQNATASASKLSGGQSGSAPVFGARAWCVFDGTVAGTNAPTAGGNVTSVTRNGVGDYTINFTTALPDGNYAPTISYGMENAAKTAIIGTTTAIAPTTTALRFSTHSSATGTILDTKLIAVAIFR